MDFGINDEMRAALDGRLLVLFDGHCGFCIASVRWLIRHDHRDRLRFAPLAEFAEFAATAGDVDSMIVVEALGGAEARVLTHSTGWVTVLGELSWPWRVMGRVLWLVPRWLRDSFYRCVARNRFRLKKRLAVCPVPTEQELRHFLGTSRAVY